jgi:hypothetical protein
VLFTIEFVPWSQSSSPIYSKQDKFNFVLFVVTPGDLGWWKYLGIFINLLINYINTSLELSRVFLFFFFPLKDFVM